VVRRLGWAGIRADFVDAPCIALGVTGGGVNAANPDARSRFLSWEQLAGELCAAAAHTHEVYVCSLEGCVARGVLESIAEIRCELPAPVLPRGEEGRARGGRRITQWVLRAEPLFDLLLPSRRQ
jgi:hypothetical protein